MTEYVIFNFPALDFLIFQEEREFLKENSVGLCPIFNFYTCPGN